MDPVIGILVFQCLMVIFLAFWGIVQMQDRAAMRGEISLLKLQRDQWEQNALRFKSQYEYHMSRDGKS